MTTKYIMALDAGTTGIRAIIYNSNVEIVGEASQEFTQKLYEQASQSDQSYASTGGGADSGSQPNDDEVVDAEIVDDDQNTGTK